MTVCVCFYLKRVYSLLNNHSVFTSAVDPGVTSVEILHIVQKYTVYSSAEKCILKQIYFRLYYAE